LSKNYHTLVATTSTMQHVLMRLNVLLWGSYSHSALDLGPITLNTYPNYKVHRLHSNLTHYTKKKHICLHNFKVSKSLKKTTQWWLPFPIIEHKNISPQHNIIQHCPHTIHCQKIKCNSVKQIVTQQSKNISSQTIHMQKCIIISFSKLQGI
jgi:hypothetical protein